MASGARIFFAGIGTAFIIIAAGFGGGLMFASSALQDTQRLRASSKQIDPVRVILPTTSEAAEAPAATPQTTGAAQQVPATEIQSSDKQLEKVDAEAESRARKKRYAERKARKNAAAKRQMEARHQIEQRAQPGLLAFSGGEQPQSTAGFFGQ